LVSFVHTKKFVNPVDMCSTTSYRRGLAKSEPAPQSLELSYKAILYFSGCADDL
jgi:hypothetical protein